MEIGDAIDRVQEAARIYGLLREAKPRTWRVYDRSLVGLVEKASDRAWKIVVSAIETVAEQVDGDEFE